MHAVTEANIEGALGQVRKPSRRVTLKRTLTGEEQDSGAREAHPGSRAF